MTAFWLAIALMAAVGVHLIRKAKREADRAEAEMRREWPDARGPEGRS